MTGISEKMLVQQLREMESDGIVARKDFREIPPRVEYSLTGFGVSLSEALRSLCDWGREHMSRIEKAKAEAGWTANDRGLAHAAVAGGPDRDCGGRGDG